MELLIVGVAGLAIGWILGKGNRQPQPLKVKGKRVVVQIPDEVFGHLREIAIRRDLTPSKVFNKALVIGLRVEAADRNPEQRLYLERGSKSGPDHELVEIVWDDTEGFRDFEIPSD